MTLSTQSNQNNFWLIFLLIGIVSVKGVCCQLFDEIYIELSSRINKVTLVIRVNIHSTLLMINEGMLQH